MAQKIYAVVTGAIRNDVYLRIMLIKLCDLRAKKIIDNIVVSTWLGEVDKYDGLRDAIDGLSIKLVEKPYIDENVEGKFNSYNFERQRTTLANAIKYIPSGSFVLKLRTDFDNGLGLLLRRVRENVSLETRRYGEFPLVFSHKILMNVWEFRQLIFANDRFFLASKEDMSKISLPVSNRKIRKTELYIENELLFGYVYHFYPLFRETWEIIPKDLYSAVIRYCNSHGNKEIHLPKLLHRIFATACVFLYTQVNLLNYNDDNLDGELVDIIELYRDKIRTNKQIEAIVFGRLQENCEADKFKEELRKIALNVTEVHGYTLEEYNDLNKFVEEQLGLKNYLEPYSFITGEKATEKIDKNAAAEWLLRDYQDEASMEKIVSLIDDNFSSIGPSVYGRHRCLGDGPSNLEVELLKAGVFDSDLVAISDYADAVLRGVVKFDKETWNHAIKYFRILAMSRFDSNMIVAAYNILSVYTEILSDGEGQVHVVYDAVKDVLRKIPIIDIEKKDINNERDFLHIVIDSLYNDLNNKEKLPEKKIRIIEALLVIKQYYSPFSPELYNVLKQHCDSSLIKKIVEVYPIGCFFNKAVSITSYKVKNMLWRGDIIGFVSFAQDIKEDYMKDAKAIMHFIWSEMPKLETLDERQKALTVLVKLADFERNDVFENKMAHFLVGSNLQIKTDNLQQDLKFFLLLEVLYRRRSLTSNLAKVKEMCFENPKRQMGVFFFLYLERDPTLSFFTIKNGSEFWIHYRPYLELLGSRFDVLKDDNDRTWPFSDRQNYSPLAGYIKLVEDGIFLSVEFCTADRNKSYELGEKIGYEKSRSYGKIVKLKTKHIKFLELGTLEKTVECALQNFCVVAKNVVEKILSEVEYRN